MMMDQLRRASQRCIRARGPGVAPAEGVPLRMIRLIEIPKNSGTNDHRMLAAKETRPVGAALERCRCFLKSVDHLA
jgi:hypothetical protein